MRENKDLLKLECRYTYLLSQDSFKRTVLSVWSYWQLNFGCATLNGSPLNRDLRVLKTLIRSTFGEMRAFKAAVRSYVL